MKPLNFHIAVESMAVLSVFTEPIVAANTLAKNSKKKYVQEYTVPVTYNSFKQKIAKIYTLNNNWDGCGAIKPDYDVYLNANDFLDKLDNKILNCLNEDNIIPTPYGTIVLDFQKESNLISVEIGEKQIGFFTEFSSGQNYESNGFNFPLRSMPTELVNAFRDFLKHV